MHCVCVVELHDTASYIKLKTLQQHPNSQPSDYKSAHDYQKPRRTAARNTQIVNDSGQEERNLSVDFDYSCLAWGGTAWSFCFVRNSLFIESLKRI
jgi:hypothetical protein